VKKRYGTDSRIILSGDFWVRVKVMLNRQIFKTTDAKLGLQSRPK